MVTDDSTEFCYWTSGTHGLYRAPMEDGRAMVMSMQRWAGGKWVEALVAAGRMLKDGGADYDDVTADEAARRFPAAFRHV